jgi:large subunit ribosomal protein L29
MADAKVKMVDIRDRSDDELAVSLDRARDELFRLKLNRTTNQIENVMQIRQKRREVARILTVISARKKGLEGQKGAAAQEVKE